MKAIERRLVELENMRPGFIVPSPDAPVQSLGFFEWLYLAVTLPADAPQRAKLRELRWSNDELDRAITDKRAMRELFEALPKASRALLLEGFRIKAAQHTAALK